jgi:hypothetical protein
MAKTFLEATSFQEGFSDIILHILPREYQSPISNP